MALACQAARQGVGIVFGPAFALAPWIAAGDLVPVLADFDCGALDVHALYLSKRHMSKKLRLLIDFLSARFSRPVGTDAV
jgi:DNA-binding transcriptional LysR family regulator